MADAPDSALSRSRTRRPVTRRVAVAGASALVLVLAGGGLAYALSDRPTAHYRVATARLGSVSQTVATIGTVTSANQASVSFPVSGTVAAVRATPGMPVNSGDVLATLDTASLQQQLNQAQATVAQDQQTLAQDQASQTGTATPTSVAISGSGTASSGGSTAPSAAVSSALTAVTRAQKAVVAAQQQIDQDLAVAQQAATVCAQAAAASPAGGSGAQSPTSASSTPTPTHPAPTATAPATTPPTAATASPTTTPTAGRAAYLRPTGTAGRPTGPAPTGTASGSSPDVSCRALAEEVGNQPSVTELRTMQSAAEQALTAAVGNLEGAMRSAGSATPRTSGAATSGSSGPAVRGTAGSATSISGRSPSAPASAEQLTADQAQIDAASAQLTVAQQDLAEATLTSPLAGTVADVEITPGESVSASSSAAVITVIGPGTEQVAATVPLTTVSSLKPGDRASVTVDGVSTPLTGRLASIGVMSTTTGSTTSFPITVALDPSSVPLRDGTGATVRVTVASVDNVLTVPTSAVRVTGTFATVALLRGGTPVITRVTVGARGPTVTEIRSGLSAGDSVVLADLTLPLPTNSTTSRRGFGGVGGSGVGAGFSGAGGRVGFSGADGGRSGD